MPSGELVLCDYNNRVVKVLNPDFTLKEQVQVPSGPWYIDIMSNDEVIITLPYTASLSFLKMHPKLQTGSSIQLDQDCRGVAASSGSIYVSFYTGEVRILDRAGNQQKNIYSSLKFNVPYYVSVPTPDMLYVSEHNAHTIRLLNKGKEMYSYKHSELKYPLAMFIDGEENVFTCGHNSHNVHIIDKNGKHKKVFLAANDGLRQPYTLSFRSSDKSLVGGGVTGQSIMLVTHFSKF